MLLKTLILCSGMQLYLGMWRVKIILDISLFFIFVDFSAQMVYKDPAECYLHLLLLTYRPDDTPWDGGKNNYCSLSTGTICCVMFSFLCSAICEPCMFGGYRNLILVRIGIFFYISSFGSWVKSSIITSSTYPICCPFHSALK